MDVPMHQHFIPGAALPDPVAPLPGSPTRWGAPAQDYPTASDGATGSGWADVVEPPAALPVIEPPALRVGWLTGQRPETDPAV